MVPPLTPAPTIAIVGLGYVGLPLACEFSRFYPVIGFDINKQKIENLKAGIDETGEVSADCLASLTLTMDPKALKQASVVIATVPTPIDDHNQPNLDPIRLASQLIGENLSAGATVVFESTVYPGVTEDICIPLLEKHSGLHYPTQFKVGYSPERLSPGESERSLTKIIKVVSAGDPDTLTFLAQLYGSIIPAGIHQAPSIKVAEAAKVIENTQRDLNVALMNELSIIFNRMGISTQDVLAAAGTKWNFIRMTPGLVGGHCIGVDPYYLTFKAQSLGYHPEVILAGRRINDTMGKYVAEQVIKHLIKAHKPIRGCKVLIMGVTFKQNVADIRNSKVVDIVRELEEYDVEVLICDPFADPDQTHHEYGLTLTPIDQVTQADAVVLAVPHAPYTPEALNKLLQRLGSSNAVAVLADLKGYVREMAQTHHPELMYWAL